MPFSAAFCALVTMVVMATAGSKALLSHPQPAVGWGTQESCNKTRSPPTHIKRDDATSSGRNGPGGPQKASIALRARGYHTNWVGQFQIGKSEISMDLRVDTGTAHLWVHSNAQDPSEIVEGHNSYDRSGILHSSYTWGDDLGKGYYALGDVFLDKVQAGSLTLENQIVEAARSVTPGWAKITQVDGIFGMGLAHFVIPLSGFSYRRMRSFFEGVSSKLVEPLFVISLEQGDGREDGSGTGTLDFGYTDDQKCIEPSITVPIIEPSAVLQLSEEPSRAWGTVDGHWKIRIYGFGIGTGLLITYPYEAIITTATPMIHMSPTFVKLYYAKVPNSTYVPELGGHMYQCPNDEIPPYGLRYEIAVSDTPQHLFIPARFMRYKRFAREDKGNEMWCLGTLQTNEDKSLEKNIIIGSVIFMMYCVAHNLRIKFPNQPDPHRGMTFYNRREIWPEIAAYGQVGGESVY